MGGQDGEVHTAPLQGRDYGILISSRPMWLRGLDPHDPCRPNPPTTVLTSYTPKILRVWTRMCTPPSWYEMLETAQVVMWNTDHLLKVASASAQK